jgi:hypothetical protein
MAAEPLLPRIAAIAQTETSMMRILRPILTAFALLCCGLPAAQTLSVDFVRPERFTDATFIRGPGRDVERDGAMREIEEHLRGLVRRHLPANQSLAIDVRDIDLAGRLEPVIGFPDGIRVLHSFTWPAITLRYRLTDAGLTLAERDERIVDTSYQVRATLYANTDRLRYEKSMLDEWFEARIVHRRPPP